MDYIIGIGVIIFIVGLYMIGTAFNNATKWPLEKAVNVSQGGVVITFAGIALVLICLSVKAAFLR